MGVVSCEFEGATCRGAFSPSGAECSALVAGRREHLFHAVRTVAGPGMMGDSFAAVRRT